MVWSSPGTWAIFQWFKGALVISVAFGEFRQTCEGLGSGERWREGVEGYLGVTLAPRERTPTLKP